MSVQFCPLASGSSGNCIFVGTEQTKILIDAGLSGKRIENNLSSIRVLPSEIDAIFITHEHIDHVRGAGILSRRYDIPIYATGRTWEYMDNSSLLGKVELKNKRYVYAEETCTINDISVLPFEIPHDASEPVGYSLKACNHKISVATDIGHASDTIKENLADSTVILLESNHDVDMLMNGAYPQNLKRRILGKNGHLSNVSAADLLTSIMSEKIKHVFLGHLSEENNHPTLAFETVKNILENNKISIGSYLNLSMAERYTASKLIELKSV